MPMDHYGVPSLQSGKPDYDDDGFDQQLLTQNTGEELTGPNISGSSQLFQFCAHFREFESSAFFWSNSNPEFDSFGAGWGWQVE